MSSDIQVVEVGEANSLVPNLTISVDNAEGEKDLPEIEYNNDISEEMPLSSETTQVKRRLDLFPRKVSFSWDFYLVNINLNLTLQNLRLPVLNILVVSRPI